MSTQLSGIDNSRVEERARRVKELFIRIAMIADFTKDKKERDAKIKPIAEELWAISQIQEANGELNHFLSENL